MSVTTNVLRFSFLGLGAFYGFSHQMSLNSASKAAAAKHEYDQKQDVINRAKAEFAKRNAPIKPASTGTDITTDPEDPRFDLEAVLKSAAERS